jgi:hypothetical protein
MKVRKLALLVLDYQDSIPINEVLVLHFLFGKLNERGVFYQKPILYDSLLIYSSDGLSPQKLKLLCMKL